jgi:hypothetical protein
LRLAPVGLLSVFAPRVVRRRDTLTVLRAVFVWWVVAPFLFLFGLVQINPERSGQAPVWMTILFAVYSIYGLASFVWARKRPLVPDTPELAAALYRAKFFLRLGLALAPSGMGFALMFLAGRLLFSLAGVAISLLALALSAPTQGDIERHQRQINAEGSSVSLLQALLSPSPGSDESRRIRGEVRERYRRKGRR